MIQSLRQQIIKEYHEWKHVLLICFLINLLAYGFYITNVTYSVDDYYHIFSDSTTIVSGRWVIDFFHNTVFQTSLSPTLIAICSIMFFLFTGIGICKFWGLRGNSCILIITLWSTHPYFLDFYNFRFATLPIACGYFLAITALWLSTQRPKGIIFSIILYYLVLSTYQAILGFTIALIMFRFLFICFEKSFSREAFTLCVKLSGKYILMLIGSSVLYLVLTNIIFYLFEVQINARIQGGLINSIDQVYPKICLVIKILMVRLLPIREYILPLAGKLLMWLIYICAMFSLFRKCPKRLYALLVLWIALIPIGAILFMIPLSAVSRIPWRACSGLVVFFVGMFALTQMVCSGSIRKLANSAGILLVIYFILISNTVWYKEYLRHERDVFVANRIISKIQTLEGYKPRMELAVLGRYLERTKNPRPQGRLASFIWEIRYRSSTTRGYNKSAFALNWSKYTFLLNYLDAELVRCSDDSLEKARDLAKDRKAWPDPSSVFIHEDIAIVLLSVPEIPMPPLL